MSAVSRGYISFRLDIAIGPLFPMLLLASLKIIGYPAMYDAFMPGTNRKAPENRAIAASFEQLREETFDGVV